ncbi:MAG: C25 family cysteine peptidase, partial [Ignavibacteria bacterium]|nr:C25 family cysteine peptidase [Ignavibacteria bacterium]
MRAVNSFFYGAGRFHTRSVLSFLRGAVPPRAVAFPAFLTCLFLVALLNPAFAGPGDDQVRIIRSDQQSLVFEYTPRYHDPELIREGSTEFTRYDFDGSVRSADPSRTGHPDLGFSLFTAAFPSETGHAIQILDAEYEEIQNVIIAPVPSLREMEGVPATGSYMIDRDRYAVSGFQPENVAVLAQVGRVRSMFIGSVRITPVLYDAARRTARKYTRILVEVVFSRPAGARISTNDAELFGNLLLNREVARSWQFGSVPGGRRSGKPSVLANGPWYRIPVTREGVYIIDALFLQAAGIDRAGIDPRTIKIYGNGGGVVPEFVGAARPVDLVENAVFVQGESDGIFQEDDFVIFYGRPTRSWNYNPITKRFDHTNHFYTETNYYWLTFGGATGKRMTQETSLTDPPDLVPTFFTGLSAVDEDTLNILGSGKDWYGPLINPNSTLTYTRSLPGLVPGLPRSYRVSFVYRTVGVGATLTVTESGITIGSEGLLAIPNGNEFQIALEKTFIMESEAPITGTTSQVSFRYATIDPAGSGWLSWMEIQYPRSFTATGNYLRFRSPDTTAIIEYNLNGFTAQPLLFDVTDGTDVRLISGATGSYTFRAAADSGTVREYCAVAAGAYLVPSPMTPVSNQDLRGITGGYDFIIVTSPEYRSAANRLAGLREQPEHGDLRTLVVEVEQIYNEFSGGLPDVTATRDFLKYALDNWTTPPSFVLFFGQGSFDYKARFGFKSSFVPTWQSLESRHDLSSYASDDFFVKFSETSSSPSIVTGRLNPRTPAEAEFLVDKLIAYDEQSANDPWKLRILIVGDDSWTPEREDGAIHSNQAESLAESHSPDEMEKRKIFIAEYPTTITA